MGFFDKPETPGMPAPAMADKSAPPPTSPIQGQKPKRRPMQQTFLGPESIPGGAGMTPAGGGGKTLLGQ